MFHDSLFAYIHPVLHAIHTLLNTHHPPRSSSPKMACPSPPTPFPLKPCLFPVVYGLSCFFSPSDSPPPFILVRELNIQVFPLPTTDGLYFRWGHEIRWDGKESIVSGDSPNLNPASFTNMYYLWYFSTEILCARTESPLCTVWRVSSGFLQCTTCAPGST